MPIFKAGSRLIYYAHVPKCGGSATAWYLKQRFSSVAFSDNSHNKIPVVQRWSKTSPQHIDRDTLQRLFPADFFDATFTIVRHPIPRLISAYHFQVEVEERLSRNVSFSNWLEELGDMREENPFLFDNHVRPMTEIVPDEAHVFYMEHGLDAMIPWLDGVTGEKAAPRAIPVINKKGAYSGETSDRVTPSDNDLDRIARLYAADFDRFGYDPKTIGAPNAPQPVLPPGFEEERDAALRGMDNPLTKLRNKIASKLRV